MHKTEIPGPLFPLWKPRQGNLGFKNPGRNSENGVLKVSSSSSTDSQQISDEEAMKSSKTISLHNQLVNRALLLQNDDLTPFLSFVVEVTMGYTGSAGGLQPRHWDWIQLAFSLVKKGGLLYH